MAYQKQHCAIMFAGAPGSGKSFYAKNFEDDGWAIYNTDPLFEQFLMELGVNPKHLARLGQEEFDLLTEHPDGPRQRAKALMQRRRQRWETEGTSIVFDGTGDDYDKVVQRKQRLEDLGYAVAMVFVQSDLATSLRRNRHRPRVLPDQMVGEMWYKVQRNLPRYRKMFGQNFFYVDNQFDIRRRR